MIIAATGHRPDKLGGYAPAVHSMLVALARAWLAGQSGVDGVILGMALGWDQAVAEAAMQLGVPVHAALPFPEQAARWPEAAQAHHAAILSNCASVTTVSARYSSAAMQLRNEWMVDRAHFILALWDGTPGGTGNCVRYAKRRGKPGVNLFDGLPGVPLHS